MAEVFMGRTVLRHSGAKVGPPMTAGLLDVLRKRKKDIEETVEGKEQKPPEPPKKEPERTLEPGRTKTDEELMKELGIKP